jgi:hypothetical protein
MSKLCLSHEDFTRAWENCVVGVIQDRRGIVVRGPHPNSPERRFNNRKLQRWPWCEVKYFVNDDAILGPSVVVFTVDGWYLTTAYLKRPYYPQDIAFHNALDLDPIALRQLYRNGPIGWRGRPWHEHLAAVLWNVMTEPPMEQLPWSGNQ